MKKTSAILAGLVFFTLIGLWDASIIDKTPTVEINSPLDGAIYSTNDLIAFQADAPPTWDYCIWDSAYGTLMENSLNFTTYLPEGEYNHVILQCTYGETNYYDEISFTVEYQL